MGISSSVDVEPQPKIICEMDARPCRAAFNIFTSAGGARMRSEGGPCSLHGMHAAAAAATNAAVVAAAHFFPSMGMYTRLLRFRERIRKDTLPRRGHTYATSYNITKV